MRLFRNLAIAGILGASALGISGCYTQQEAYDICAFSNPVPGTAIIAARWNGNAGRIECRGESINPFGTPREWCAYPPKSPPDNYWGSGPCNW